MSRTRDLARRLAKPILRRIDARVDSRLDARLAAESAADASSDDRAIEQEAEAPSRRFDVFVPQVAAVLTSQDADFMKYSTCSAVDFRHPEFTAICAAMGFVPSFHRKLWEHVFIVHQLRTNGMLAAGKRGVGFGVGSEPLPALFAAAGCEITATDAPPEIADGTGWTETMQYAETIEQLRRPDICADAEFDALVEHRHADMNHIPADLVAYDFCWSACCFEHLGSLRHGADFVVETVERVLRPGGIAVHTTEFNLSSNDDTLESEGLSVYRRSDMDELIERLRERGHFVDELTVAPDAHYLDQYVDLPPYGQRLHLKLQLAGYVTTSVGLVVRRGLG